MAIEKMKLISITGPEKDLDRFIAKNLLDTDIQIEDAKKVYNKGWKFEYYGYDYTIKENIKKCKDLIEKLEIPYREEYSNLFIENTVEQIGQKIDNVKIAYEKLINDIDVCQKDKEKEAEKIKSVEKLVDLEIDVKKLYNLKYIRFRYGNISNDRLEYIKSELEDINVILFEVAKEEEFTWIIYVTTDEYVDNVDVFFNTQNFERVWLDPELSGTPKEYIDNIYKQISDKNLEIIEMQKEIKSIQENCRHILLSSYRQLQTYDKINRIKKYIMHDSKNTFYIVAWVPETETEKLSSKLDTCQNIDYTISEKSNNKSPTKLKNNRFIKPFEILVKMYGVPNTNEIDPTFFVAITAFLMFGFMFGDVGHGLVFLIAGLILRRKNKDFGDILAFGGISSTIFGLLYGSIFGKEIISPIIISPMENINTMLIYGIIVGCIFILIAMILNIINGIKNKDFKRIWLERKWSCRTCFIWIYTIFNSILFLKRKITDF